MTIWVLRSGAMVIKGSEADIRLTPVAASDFPTPMISRIEAYHSPITDALVTSWRQRDREMNAHDCYDPRDLPKGHTYAKSKRAKP